jgi:DNA-binding NarL/FixJ family response regulator
MKRVLIADANNAFRQGLAALLEEQASLKAVAQAASLAEARHVLPDVDHNVELAVVGLDLYDVDATLLIEDPQESRVSAQREVDLEPIHIA